MLTANAPTAVRSVAGPERRRRWAVALLCAALFLVALAPAAGSAEAAKKKNLRIAALTPFSVQTLAKLGVKPVVIGETVTGDAGIPKKFRNIPQIPLSHASNGPNPEQLVQRNVKTVLSERTWNGGHKALEGFGMKVHEFDPTALAQYGAKIKRIGKFVGKQKKAKKLAKSMKKKIRKSTRGITSRPKTLVLLGVGAARYAFLPSSWGGNLFSQAGATLATDGLTADGGTNLMISGGFAQLSLEEIAVQQPDVIVAIPHGNADDLDEIEDSLREDTWLKDTNAGRNDRIYVTGNNSLLQPDLRVPAVLKMIRGDYLRNR